MKKLIIVVLFPILVFCQSPLDSIQLLINNSNYDEAEKLLKEHTTNYPNDQKALELYGDVYSHKKNWDKAIIIYKKLVDAKPNESNYHYKYGGALGMKALSISKMKALSLIPSIKEAFTKAAELDPKHIETRWALVELYMQLPALIGGSMSKSLKYATELEALSKVDGLLAKGYIYEYDNQLDLAEGYYKQAITVGGSVTCYTKQAQFYEKSKKQPEKAISIFEEAQNIHQNNALNYQIGKLCADYNVQLQKGEDYLNTFIKEHSVQDDVPIEWAYLRLAQLYKHKKHKAKALKFIEKALAVHPNFEQAQKEKEIILVINE